MRRFQPAVGLLFVGDSLTFPPSLSGRFAMPYPLRRDRAVRNFFRSSRHAPHSSAINVILAVVLQAYGSVPCSHPH